MALLEYENARLYMRISSLTLGLVVIIYGNGISQPRSLGRPASHVWGAASNGISAAVSVTQTDWATHKNDFYCDIDVRNVTTNRLYIWVPPLEQRYVIELRGPDGRPVRQLKPLRLSQKQPWLGREPLSDDGHCLDWCFLKETFDVRTNGPYTLIVAVRANAFTNFATGLSQMRRKPAYFLLPPVTNCFRIVEP
jgi:hypothetical protein